MSAANRLPQVYGSNRPAGAERWNSVWFAGVHSNVGGSYSPDGLANEALHWIIEKVEDQELEFDKPFLQHYLPCFNSVLIDSMTLIYKMYGATRTTDW